jgi:hypothetical protein
MIKPSAESERAEKEQWIRAKYVDLAFMAKEDKIAILVRCWRGGIGRPSPRTHSSLYYVAQCFSRLRARLLLFLLFWPPRLQDFV